MSEMYQIQKDGLRPAGERRQAAKQPRRKFPVESMEPGDSFFVYEKRGKSVSSYISRITKNLPGRFATEAGFAYAEDGKWVSCGENDEGAVAGVTVTRVE